ncbi:MAG: succinate dehydrogenase, hydrophobic membrane anchor protein [Rickettsiaceae bacterium]|nr:succinate dehydrogenase, hydrophobic membrane anchor protein [Rickettsiaceae bacterium]
MRNSEFFLSDLKRAKNLGSSGHGSEHWIMQRMSALLLIPLILWLIYFIYEVLNSDHNEITDKIASPSNIAPLLLIALTSIYHSTLGMQVVIEDYVSCKCVRNFLIIGIQLFGFVTGFFLCFASIYFILKV